MEKHGVMQQGVMGQEEDLLKTEYSRTVGKKKLKSKGMMKGPELPRKYV